ncbi:MAG: hypothetical protein AAGC68_09135, partial [Verrucomicrobiota bacterium]
VVASLDPQLPMEPRGTGELPSHWKLNQRDPDSNLVTKGQWTEVGEQPCLEGEFYVARRNEKQPLIRRGVAINGAVRMGTPYLQLGAESVFRLRYRTDAGSDESVSVFLSTRSPKGRFGGNFTSWISATESRALEDGFREVVIPIADFKLTRQISDQGADYNLVDNELTKILISVPREHQVQVAHVSVENGDLESIDPQIKK